MRLFGSESRDSSRETKGRTPRHSSGWDALRKELAAQEGLRVLDVGATSSNNINLLTAMGQSVYMADLTSEAQDKRWRVLDDPQAFRTDDFLTETLALGNKLFDIVLLWDTLDFVPPAVVQPLVDKLHASMTPGGKLLAFFRVKPEGLAGRYHLGPEQLDVQPGPTYSLNPSLTNRQIESVFSRFSSHRFFLAKDNLREVLVTR